jgi:uncharacterized protein (DUF924 family)
MGGAPNIPLTQILTPSLFAHCNEITFPWPIISDLDGAEVGHVFFISSNFEQWNHPSIKSSLISLSKIGILNITLDDLLSVLPRDREGKEFLEQVTGLILFLDQAPRILLTGVNKRYIYEYFDVLSLKLVHHLNSLPREENPLLLPAWHIAGLSTDQAMIRISMLLAPLVHSETLADQDLHLQLETDIRYSFEHETGTTDPYRKVFKGDKKDIHLFARWLGAGPPTTQGTGMDEFVFWILRYFTAHVAFVRRFRRSPFRNVSVGREEEEGEQDWLAENGIVNGEEEELVRRKVKIDKEEGIWRALEMR